MKKTFLTILLFCLLLQSCYSYRTIDLNKTKLVENKKYKIKTTDKFIKVRLIDLNDSTAVFKNGKNQNEIAISDLKAVKVRKFSVVKTVAIVPSLILIAGTGAYFAMDNKVMNGR